MSPIGPLDKRLNRPFSTDVRKLAQRYDLPEKEVYMILRNSAEEVAGTFDGFSTFSVGSAFYRSVRGLQYSTIYNEWCPIIAEDKFEERLFKETSEEDTNKKYNDISSRLNSKYIQQSKPAPEVAPTPKPPKQPRWAFVIPMGSFVNLCPAYR